MSDQSAQLIEKIRQQFEGNPYAKAPMDYSPKDNLNELFINSYATPNYLKHQAIVDPATIAVLDVGCGTGDTTLALALANPGAKVVGIDLSAASVEIARHRIAHHGILNVEFQALSLTDLPQLGMMFDYINCEEVLYLMDPQVGLQAMRSVLKPQGIIRSNLHSKLQREPFFRAQELFRYMGLMDSNPEALEIDIVVSTFQALKSNVNLKTRTWKDDFAGVDNGSQILMNYLFQGDRGYTIPDLFQALKQSDLAFVSMTRWRQWEILDLFTDPTDLPAFWEMSLAEATVEQRLSLYELLNPAYRLLDFWCGHPQTEAPKAAISDWNDTDWAQAVIHLHPVWQTDWVRQALVKSAESGQPFWVAQHLQVTMPNANFFLDSLNASLLLALWEGPGTLSQLSDRYLKIKPTHPITLEPNTLAHAQTVVKAMLEQLEVYLYVLLTQPASRPASLKTR
jgi:2-polyprenyl-3-methyl-5-hydroxy-6-metoxy-1,4-benzoquinol methylase